MDPAAIECVGILAAVGGAALAALAPSIRAVRVRAGDAVIRKGAPPDALYVIRGGKALVTDEVDGRRLVLAEIEPGGFFGEMSLIEDRPRATVVEAAEDLDLLVVPWAALKEVFQSDPAAAASFYRSLLTESSRRLRRSNELVADFFRTQLAQLRREQQEKEFMYLLAHDLRSPLAIAEGGIAQLVERQDRFGALAAAQERILKRSRRSLLFLRRLLEEILEGGRTETGQSHAEVTTLTQVLLEAVSQSLAAVDGPTLDGIDDLSDFGAVRAALARQGLAVDVDAPTLAAPLAVDKMRLVQVLMNLVGNALKYAPGAVTVRARRAEGRLEVEVLDKGPGIPDSFLASIFERYRQAGARAAGVPRGFGLGLAGARQLVEALGGRIRAEAGDGGEGTRIAFHIPWREGLE